MSKWCTRCTREPYEGCDPDCPIFGLDLSDLAEKYWQLLGKQANTEEIPDDEELLPNNCLYIKGWLKTDYDGVPAVSDSNDRYYDGNSIINKIENYAQSNGFFANTHQGAWWQTLCN